MQSNRDDVCRNIFRILLAQLIFLAIWSLVAQSGPVFAEPVFFGADFHDFYRAAADWTHRINPYLLPRFNKPPPSLLVGLPFLWIPFGAARFLFSVLNLAIVLISVRACAQKLELSNECAGYLTGITLLYYPVYLLIQRGNLDGLVLGCLCWAFCTKNMTLRGVLIALGAGLKLYPLLLVGPAVRNKHWRLALIILAALFLLFLPFYRLTGPFLNAMSAREICHLVENISPAAFIVAFTGLRLGKWIFLAYWTSTLIFMLYRERQPSEEQMILPFLPWMVAFPLQVYPYGGVLLLPVLAWKLHEMQGRKPDLSDRLFVSGFLLVGVQAIALATYFHGGGLIFHLMNSLGMCLILSSLAIPRLNRNRTAWVKPESGVNSEPQPA